MRDFPWENVMKFGLGVLGLAPDRFWAMTPRELNAAFCAHVEGRRKTGVIERQELERLLAQFPDQTGACKNV